MKKIKKMKKVLSIMLALSCVLALAACGQDDTAADTGAITALDATTATQLSASAGDTDSADTVDYDLTVMTSEMVYATVYQMLASPADYMGKTVRLSGQYYASYYSGTEQYYHYCIIADASSCCSRGMEFVLASAGTYPDDYPDNYTDIVLTGTFGSYEEEGVTYYALLNTVMELT